jgi:hypothetical protein
MLVAFTSVKSSPGVTTAALAVTASQAGGVLVECDPAGGDLAPRFGLAEGGLVNLAAAVRRAPDPALLDAHVHVLPGGTAVVAGPVGSAQAAAAVTAVAARAGEVLVPGAGRLVVADCGRVWPGSPALGVLAAAAVTVLVVRPSMAQLSHAAASIDGLKGVTGTVRLVLVGDGAYPAWEIAKALEVPVLGHLPLDDAGARVLAGAVGTSAKAAGRTRLARAARILTATVLDTATTATAEADDARRAVAVPTARWPPSGASGNGQVPGLGGGRLGGGGPR